MITKLFTFENILNYFLKRQKKEKKVLQIYYTVILVQVNERVPRFISQSRTLDTLSRKRFENSLEIIFPSLFCSVKEFRHSGADYINFN